MSIKKYAVLVLVAIILIALCLVAIPSANATPKKIIVPDDYQSIQAAVGNASSGDTVFVRSGIYAGGIALNKPLSLIGEDSKTTTIVGGVTLKELSYASQDRALSTLQGTASHSLNMITSAIKDASTTNSIHVLNANTSLANFIQPSTYAVYINSSDIIISGFTIKGGNYAISGNGSRLQVYGNNLGVCELSGSYITIANNTQPFALEIGGSFNLITGNVGSITLVSSNSTVTSNVFKGVIMQDANSNIIANNTVSGANEGMLIGFRGKTCSYNLFAGNKVEGAGLWGILMGAGSYNVFYGNMVTNTGGLGHDGYALALGGNGVIAENNLFLQNIFVNNTKNFGVNWQVTGANSFDDGKEGNYWDDYLTKYPNALEVGDSGTGNIPYPLTNHNNIDYHPLLEQPSISNKLPSLPTTWVSLLPSLSTSPSPLPSTSSSSSPSQAPSQSVLPSNSPTTPEYPPWTILALFVISLFLVAFVLTLCKSQKKKAETSFNHYSILWLNFFFSANAKRPFLGDHNE